ncbi:MAG: Ig-like domain-containing protein [Candidatus Woesearchaeota archaeon]
MAKTGYLTIVLAVIAVLVLNGCAQLLPPGWNATSSETPTGAISTEVEETDEDVSVIEEAEEPVVEEPPAAPEETQPQTPPPETTPAKQETPPPQPVQETTSPAETQAAPSEDTSLPRKVVTEGDLVSFPNLKATDPDGDPITYTFTPPLDATGKWQTKVGDAGDYRVTITASDGKNSVSQVVIIQVKPKNQPPVLQLASKEFRIKEGETVTINVQASDPDGDKVTISFSGWMTGPAKTTGYTDAGTHEVVIIASDGKATVRDTVRVIVENVNRQPVMGAIADVTVKEGDKITVKPTATDPDGDKLTFSFSPPLGPDGTWQTTSHDVGKYTVNVTVSDGIDSATTTFSITVQSLNKPPIIQMVDTITVDEGQTVAMAPIITDPEGDELTITYSGWMKSNTYTTTYEDSGSHLVTITVSDGINTVKKDVTVVVNDVNRPPTFGSGSFI